MLNKELNKEYIELNEYNRSQEILLANLIYCDANYVNQDKINNILSGLSVDMFENRKCKIIFNILTDLFKTDFDLIGNKSFIDKLKQIASLEEKNLEYFIDELASVFESFTTTIKHLKNIQNFYFKQCYKKAESEEEFIKITTEKRKYSRDLKLTKISDDALDILKQYEDSVKTSIFTPFKKVNNLIGSLQGGDMIVLAASTGCGKTCFMLNLAKGIAKKNKKVLIFSLEMPKRQLQQRIICSDLNIEYSKFRSHGLTLEDQMKIAQYSYGDLQKLNIDVYGKQTVSINEIKNTVLSTEPDIVFIDYLGLINSYDSRNTYDKFSNISRDIKLLAMEANIPIVALHQLNRSFQQRENKRPLISDLRDSGKIEQDADMIWFLYRPSLFEKNKNENEIDFILAKDRHGESNCETKLSFNGRYQTIAE